MLDFISKIEIRYKNGTIITIEHFKELKNYTLSPETEIWQILNNKQIKLTTILLYEM
jgi:hypothetical protein